MPERRFARVVVAVAIGVASVAGAAASLHLRGAKAQRAISSARCEPLRVVDRYGKLLREVPGECAPYGRSRWTKLEDVPPIVVQLVLESEDRRFRSHPGVDPIAVVRAAWSNLSGQHIVSGASTLTMQLARLIDVAPAGMRDDAAAGAKLAQRSAMPALDSRATADNAPTATTGQSCSAAALESGATASHPSTGAPLAHPRSATALGCAAKRDFCSAVTALEREGLPSTPHAIKRASWLGKLSQAWTALAIERRLRKDDILEAYINLAYYGAGAYGIDAAARAYFGKPLSSLSDAEASLLATLPRAPTAYDLRRGPTRASQRRDRILTRLVQRGALDGVRQRAIAAAPIRVVGRASGPASYAGHFVDFALSQLPAPERDSGGELRTTLDLGLQTTLERIVAEHVASLADRGVDQAGLVVLDTNTGSIRAMVGSRGYDTSQLNITVRRRQLGSLLKPFVYALAIERGESAASVALDIGDVTPDYRARDWVGREAGPLSYKEALAGSYNLAAIHTLERVGVATLHARLRSAGVAELAAPPARYGLMLALGSARVRLLDVASGYGFLMRGGMVQPAHAIEALERSDRTWTPTALPDRQIFSPAVSWQVMDMLSDAAARHRRFGLGLPLEGASPIAAKTGTASGLSDASAVVATREFIVAAWAGRFDGQPTRGTSGMWAAAPLASRALVAALAGKAATLPIRPADLPQHVAALSGTAPTSSPPPELEPWAERARVRGGRAQESAAR